MWRSLCKSLRSAWLDVRGIFAPEPTLDASPSWRGIVVVRLDDEAKAIALEESGLFRRIETTGFMVVWLQHQDRDAAIEFHVFP